MRDVHGAVLPLREGWIAPTEQVRLSKQTRFSVIPEHRHEYVEVNYVYAGRCTTVVDGATVELAEGDVVMLDSGVVHTILPTGEGDIVLNCRMLPGYFDSAFIGSMNAGGPVSRFLLNVITASREHDRHLVFHTQRAGASVP